MADQSFRSFSRRSLLQTTAAAGVAGTLGGLLPASPAAAKDVVVGFIYVGSKDDYGYNQAHAEAAAALKKMPGVKVIEEENVAETIVVQKTMESMIELDGASLIFPTSFGYFDPHMLAMCKKYPKVQFRHCGGMWSKDKHPDNAGSYFGYIGMGQYLNGVGAAHATKSKRIGLISVDPSITTQVIFTGEWSLAVKEAEAANSLINQGVDVLTCHVDGPKVVIETAERRGIFSCGYHANQQKLAPKGYLTGAEWNWETVYKGFIEKASKGETLSNFVRGGLPEGFVKMSPYGAAVSDAARKQADAVKADIMKGNFAVIKGPLKDNKGNVVAAAGVAYPETAIELESMGYLVEGVVGSIA
jgi:basic membrane protein A